MAIFHVQNYNKTEADAAGILTFPEFRCGLVDVGSHSHCSQFPAYALTYSSDVFPLLLVQHFMVRALTFKWEQPEQIRRHSQAFQKEEIYFYSSINAAGEFYSSQTGVDDLRQFTVCFNTR